MIQDMLTRLDGLAAQLRRGTSVNVNDQDSKQVAITLAKTYFAELRPSIVNSAGDPTVIAAHDEKWQHLIRLAHGNNARRTYVKTVKGLRRELAAFNVATLVAHTNPADTPPLTATEKMLIDTLERLVPSAAISYRQGLLDLRSQSRLSYRGTAAEFREALREVLDHLAPDDKVAAQPGFKLEQAQTKPTMKQKVKFVLTSRGKNKTQRESTEKSASLVEELSGEITRAIYNRASVAAHVHESKREVEQIRRYVDTIMYDLLELT